MLLKVESSFLIVNKSRVPSIHREISHTALAQYIHALNLKAMLLLSILSYINMFFKLKENMF
jgi:hypothetical protein